MASSPRRRFVTLSSDLGAAYAAQLKAVLVGAVAPGHLVDLSHELRPHNIREAGFVVRAMAERFPAGSVHVVVVDPGVGGTREPIVVACRDGSVLIGPNNGVLAPLADALRGGSAFRILPPGLKARPRVGTTFDGRDLFAPAAARVVAGIRPQQMGRPTELVRLRMGRPRRTADGATGSVVHVDRFGNVITDVPTDWLPRGLEQVRFGWRTSVRSVPVVRSYEEGGSGRLLALGSSFGTVELALPRGRAGDRLSRRVGARVRFAWPRRTGRSHRRNGK